MTGVFCYYKKDAAHLNIVRDLLLTSQRKETEDRDERSVIH